MTCVLAIDCGSDSVATVTASSPCSQASSRRRSFSSEPQTDSNAVALVGCSPTSRVYEVPESS